MKSGSSEKRSVTEVVEEQSNSEHSFLKGPSQGRIVNGLHRYVIQERQASLVG